MSKRVFKENRGLTTRLVFSAAAVLIASLLAFMSCANNGPGNDTKSGLEGKSWTVTAQKDGAIETLMVAITDNKIIVIDSNGTVVSTQIYEYKDGLFFIAGSESGIAISAGSSGLTLGADFTVPGYTDFAPAGDSTALDSGTIGDLNEAVTGDTPILDQLPASGTLNTGLHGVWQLSYTGGTDTYIITDGRIDHPDYSYGWTSASIEYVYNFDAMSGGLIVKYADNGVDKYDAVWFSGLTATQVLLGNAYFVEDYTQPTAVDTLTDAIVRFKPETAALYGGGDAQIGSLQLRQTIPASGTLNTGLVGTWKASGDGWTDTYTITAGTGDQIGTIGHAEGYTWTSATIEYVYNFDATSTSGGLIIKYTTDDGTDKFNAVWFKALTETQVLLGDAYTVADYTIDSAVDTLEAAKIRFWPANAANYGGGDAQGGRPQQKQP
jgi:hypothetical protein